MPNVTPYIKTSWQDLPNKTTAITAGRLNNAEQGIENVNTFVNQLDATAGKVLSEVAFTDELQDKIEGIGELTQSQMSTLLALIPD
jgi:hypothetical protein